MTAAHSALDTSNAALTARYDEIPYAALPHPLTHPDRLATVARLLNSISANLARITFGVRAVETQCAVIGPAVDRINGNLADVAAGLTEAAVQAERLAT